MKTTKHKFVIQVKGKIIIECDFSYYECFESESCDMDQEIEIESLKICGQEFNYDPCTDDLSDPTCFGFTLIEFARLERRLMK